MALRRFLRWLADGPSPPEDGLLFVLADSEAARLAGPLMRRLAEGEARLTVLACVRNRDAAPGVPGIQVCRVRVPRGVPVRAALGGLRARSVVVAGERRLPDGLRRLVGGARHRGLPVFALGEDGRLRGTSEPAQDSAPPEGSDTDAAIRCLVGSMGVERGQGPLVDGLATRLQAGLDMTAPRWLLAPFVRRIETVAQLRDRLRNPATILCLGNGPTSEADALAGLPHDALFRVNHQWQRRGFLDKPDMVFAGVKRSMRAVGRVPIGIATRRKERALLAARVLEFWHGRTTYAIVEEIAGDILPPVEGPLRPTTGAYMIAAAVALRPQRLVVAGIDMFSHPDGAYPGAEAVNAYSPSHDFGTDAAFIRGCLSAFEGELETLSPAFAELARSVPSARFRLVDGGAAAARG